MSEPFPSAPLAAADGPGRGDAGLPLRELIAILGRRRRVIVWVVLLLTAVATLIGLQVEKTYTATALVMVQPQETRVVDFEQVAQGLSPDGPTIETQIRFIQSYENLAHASRLLDLAAGPAEARDAAPGVLGAISDLLPDAWLIAAGLAHAPEVAADPEAVALRAVGVLRGGLQVAQSGNSHGIM